MKPSRTLGQLITAFVGVSTVSAAAWPGFLPDIDALVVRANSQTSASAQPSQTATAGSTNTNTNAAALTTGDLNTASVDPSSTGAAATGTGHGSNSTKSNSTHHQTFDPTDPAGTITMMTPAATTMALFKIGDHVTYVWNYTNLLASPTAVDVLAYDSGATLTHTLTQNMSFAVPNTLVWDTGAYQSKNGASKGLRAVMYTLTIYDADSNPTATAEAGYLAVYNGLQFGLYSPQSYTPLSDWKCVACSGAQNLGAAGAIGFAVTAAFAAGVGLMIL